MTEHLLEIQQKLDSPNEAIALFGNQDAYLKLMENELNVSIITRGEKVYVSGEEASRDTVSRLITSLLHLIRKGIEISERDVVYAIKMAQKNKLNYFENMYEDEITKNAKGKSIRVKTIGQREYAAAMKKMTWSLELDPLVQGRRIWQSSMRSIR